MSKIHSVLAGSWCIGLAAISLGAAGATLLLPRAVTATTLEQRVAASADDAEEFSTGSMYLSSSDLELIHDGSDQTVGMRWPGLAVPRGATITAAWIQFAAKEAQSEGTTLTLRAQASDNAPAFSSTSYNVTARAKTAASRSWTPAPWNTGDAGASQRTPDLSSLIQEVVNRAGWSGGNALAVIVSGIGHRTAYSFDGSASLAPLLHVEYSLGTSQDAPPAAALSVSVVSSPALTVVADGSGSTDTDATPIASYRFDFGDGTAAVTTTAPTAATQHTYAAAGSYTVSLVVTDTGGNASAAVTRSVTVTVTASGTVERRVAASSDDAEESSSGSVSLASSDLELVHDGSDQTVGMRWTNVTVPKNAVISRAYVLFRAKESQTEATTLTFRGQAADNAATFGGSAFSSRARTAAAGSWTPASWAAGDAGATQQTPDLSAVLQEIVNRSGWASGNALALIVDGTGHRTAYSFDGSSTGAPLLHVEYGGAPPPDQPPVARLAVSVATSPPLTVTADGSGSTDGDATPIKTYRFDFGDGTSAVTTTAPAASAQHTYAAAGAYTVTLRCTDTAGLQSSSVSKSVTVSAPSQVAVYAGYYDTHHTANPQPKPSPWMGASNTIFAGNPDTPGSNLWDTSAIRIDNTSDGSLSGVKVTVDIGTHHFALWGTYTIPAGQRLIVAQTGVENFDGSDTNAAGCFNCAPADCGTKVSSSVPVVHLTIGTKTTDYVDPNQVLNTHGVDSAGCPYTGTRNDESIAWQQIFPRLSLIAGAPGGLAIGSGSGMVANAPAAGPRLALTPNPSRGLLRAAFRTASAGRMRLEVMDVAGRVIRRGADELLEAGEHSRAIDLTGAAPGIYFCRLSTADGVERRPIVLTP